jgi:hypothetical protein
MKKMRVEKVHLNCLFTRKNRQQKKTGQHKKTHKLITTIPALNSDAMSSDDSKDKQNNATTKLGGQGYLSQDDYQSRRESSKGKRDHSRKDERQDKGRTEKRMQELKINSTNWKRTIKI